MSHSQEGSVWWLRVSPRGACPHGSVCRERLPGWCWGALSTPGWSRALVPAPSMPSVLGRGMLRGSVPGRIQKKKKHKQQACASGSVSVPLFWSCRGNVGCVPAEQLGESPVHRGVVSGAGCPSLLAGCWVVDVQLCPSVGMETCSSPAAPQRRAACAEMCTRARVGVQNGGERERRGQRWRKREAGTGGDFVPG